MARKGIPCRVYSPIGRDEHDIPLVGKRLKLVSRDGIMGRPDNIEALLELAAVSQYSTMLCFSWNARKLNDNVNRLLRIAYAFQTST